MPLLLQSAFLNVPSYIKSHFFITLPELEFSGSCCDSILLTSTCSKKKGMIYETPSVHKMKGKKVKVPEDEQFIHENFMPAIINEEDFYMVQELFDKRVEEKVRAKNQKIHKYAQVLIQKKSLTNTNISLLIDKIIIKETDELGEYNRPKLDIEVV